MTKPDKSDESTKATVQRRALELLAKAPAGLRFSEIRERLDHDLPNVPRGTIAGALVGFANELPDEILKPWRGHYVHAKYAGSLSKPDTGAAAAVAGKGKKGGEAAFYQPFADWLVNEIDECTRAIPLGGSKFGNKWGTPDVIGVREQLRGSLIAFPTEIVSAEIKTESSQLIVAFGQAVAYRLFSHKSYLVIPVTSSEEDVGRLDVLSRIVGIGLILFDSTSPADPRFSIRVRAMKHEPDGFYLNECVRHVEKNLFG